MLSTRVDSEASDLIERKIIGKGVATPEVNPIATDGIARVLRLLDRPRELGGFLCIEFDWRLREHQLASNPVRREEPQ
jgi:hypothetical protein